MKLEVTNENYNAVVVEVKNLVSVGLNTLVAFPVFGYQALVPNKTKPGDILVLFHCPNIYRYVKLVIRNSKQIFFPGKTTRKYPTVYINYHTPAD